MRARLVYSSNTKLRPDENEDCRFYTTELLSCADKPSLVSERTAGASVFLSLSDTIAQREKDPRTSQLATDADNRAGVFGPVGRNCGTDDELAKERKQSATQSPDRIQLLAGSLYYNRKI